MRSYENKAAGVFVSGFDPLSPVSDSVIFQLVSTVCSLNICVITLHHTVISLTELLS